MRSSEFRKPYHIYFYTYISIYIYIYIHIYIYIYIYIYIDAEEAGGRRGGGIDVIDIVIEKVICEHIYTYIYIYTFIHTYIDRGVWASCQLEIRVNLKATLLKVHGLSKCLCRCLTQPSIRKGLIPSAITLWGCRASGL